MQSLTEDANAFDHLPFQGIPVIYPVTLNIQCEISNCIAGLFHFWNYSIPFIG